MFRAEGRRLLSIPRCQSVQDERTCRRNCAARHILLGSIQPLGYISQHQYEALKGSAYQTARRFARSEAVEGRAIEKVLWREGFAFLYPDFARIKQLLNPFGYDDPDLGRDDLRQACARARQREEQASIQTSGVVASSITFPPASSRDPSRTQGSTHQTMPGQATHAGYMHGTGAPTRSYASAVITGPIVTHQPHWIYPDPNQGNGPRTTSMCQPVQANLQQALRSHQHLPRYRAPNETPWSEYSAQDRFPLNVGQTLGSNDSQGHPQVPSWIDQQSSRYQQPVTATSSRLRDFENQSRLHPEHAHPYNLAMQNPADPWTPVRSLPADFAQARHSQQTTDPEMSSSRHPPPTLRDDLSSIQTGRTWHPQTPILGDPVSPSPQYGDPGLLSHVRSGAEIPLEFIDPRLLQKNPGELEIDQGPASQDQQLG